MQRRRLFALATALTALPALARASGGKKTEKKKGGGESYIQINSLTATIFRPDGRRGVLSVECGIDAPDEKVRIRAEQVVPRLRAGFVQALQIYAAGLTPSTPPNVDYIGAELQRMTDQIVGRKGAKLLLGTVLVN